MEPPWPPPTSGLTGGPGHLGKQLLWLLIRTPHALSFTLTRSPLAPERCDGTPGLAQAPSGGLLPQLALVAGRLESAGPLCGKPRGQSAVKS